MPQAQTHKRQLKPWKKVVIGLVTISVLVASIAISFLTGFGYTVSRIRCCHQPFVKVGAFEPNQTYLTPNSPLYKSFASNFGSKYYCSEQQAQADGLTRDKR